VEKPAVPKALPGQRAWTAAFAAVTSKGNFGGIRRLDSCFRSRQTAVPSAQLKCYRKMAKVELRASHIL